MYSISIRTSRKCEFIDITSKISSIIRESEIDEGICTVFVPHTTAAVTINENADPDVLHDIAIGLSFVRDDSSYRHAEGNSVAHIKTSLFGSSETIIITNGNPVLGTWQGIYFCEFDGPRNRKIHVSVLGK